MKLILSVACSAAILAMGACAPKEAAKPAEVAAAAPRPMASIQEIMLEGVDPAADAVWESVSSTYDERGLVEKKPETDADWHDLRKNALFLVEGPNLLAMEGRHVASAVKLPEMDPDVKTAEVEQRIVANPAGFRAMALGMQGVGTKIVAAIDKRDTAALVELGGELDEACEACHMAFWYPEDAAAQAAKPPAQQKN